MSKQTVTIEKSTLELFALCFEKQRQYLFARSPFLLEELKKLQHRVHEKLNELYGWEIIEHPTRGKKPKPQQRQEGLEL